jgi:hypothetical protein
MVAEAVGWQYGGSEQANSSITDLAFVGVVDFDHVQRQHALHHKVRVLTRANSIVFLRTRTGRTDPSEDVGWRQYSTQAATLVSLARLRFIWTAPVQSDTNTFGIYVTVPALGQFSK